MIPSRLKRWARRFNRYADLEPFEVFMSALCVLAGLPLLLNGPAPGTLEQHLPLVLVRLWGFELVLGGLLTLIGLAFAGTLRGYRTERTGLSFLATASFVYALVLMVVAWPAGIASIAILIGFSGACVWRRSSMTRTLVIRTPRR